MAEHDYLDNKHKKIQKKTPPTSTPETADPKHLTPLTLQRMIGNQRTQQVLTQRQPSAGQTPSFIQTKLNVGAADDSYEKEADRVAQQVVNNTEAPVQRAGEEEELQAKRMDIQRAGEEDELQAKRMDVQRQTEEENAPAAMPMPILTGLQMKRMDNIQRAGPEEELQAKRMEIQRAQEEDELAMKRTDIQRAGEEEELQAKRSDIQRAADMSGAFEVGGGLEQAILSKKGQGQPIADDTRSQLEGGFGHDFSAVNVHNDTQSDALNRSLNARAFTMGNDVFFRQGEYQPSSKSGQELLAHELTHVVQQGAASPKVDKKDQE